MRQGADTIKGLVDALGWGLHYRESLADQSAELPRGLVEALRALPNRQRLVVEQLLGRKGGRTYADVAAELAVHIGTVHRQLKRLRDQRPDLYAAIVVERARQLALRHVLAAERAAEHSSRWHRQQSSRRFYYRFGRWPWERW